MIKIRLPQSEPSSITFTQSAINLLDKILDEPDIQKIPIKSRGVLVACIVMALSEKFSKLAADLQELYTHQGKGSDQMGVYFKPNMDHDLDRMMQSKAAYDLVSSFKPAIIVFASRSLLSELNPRYNQTFNAFQVSLSDIKVQYEKLQNAKGKK